MHFCVYATRAQNISRRIIILADVCGVRETREEPETGQEA